MSIVVKVENLGKKYTITHQRRRGRDSLREAMTHVARGAWQRLRHPFSPNKEMLDSEEIWALRDVNFEVEQGARLGIIGRNGAGKSTLLKILSRITEPTTGRVHLKGRVSSLLEVGTGFHPELTGRENIFLNGAILGMTGREIRAKFDEIVAFSEIEKFLDTPVKRYSSGMYVRLAFAVAAHLEPEILIVDEVLAVGDAAFQKKCLGKMDNVAKEGRTVLFVSHNMAAISHLCSGALLLGMGRLVYTGSAAETIDFYEQQFLSGEVNKEYPPHIIFNGHHDECIQARSDFKITRIELLDQKGLPKPIVSTWDAVTFRITYWARNEIDAGAAVLRISTRHGVSLLYCSTQPDFKVPMKIKTGYHTVECEFASLPLAAGEYVVGAGLAIPNKEWLCFEDYIGNLIVHPKDVYQSGMAPIVSRCILATPHTWRVE